MTGETAGSPGARTGRRRWPIGLAIGLALLLGLRAALPAIAQYGLERMLASVLQASVKIGDVGLGLFQGEVELVDVELADAESGVELLHLGALVLDADWGALLTGSLEAERLMLEEPRLLVAFDAEGRLNWEAIGGGRDVGEAPREPAEPASAFVVRVEELEIGTGVVRLLDAAEDGLPSLRVAIGGLVLGGAEISRPSPGAPIRWALASARATDWTLGVSPDDPQSVDFALRASAGPASAAGTLPIELELEREDGVELRVTGTLDPDPLDLRLRAQWKELSSRAVTKLLALAGVRAVEGRSDGDLELALALGDVPERGLSLAGTFDHRDLLLEVEGDTRISLEVPAVSAQLERLWLPIPEAVEEQVRMSVRFTSIEISGSSLDGRVAPAEGAKTSVPEALEVLEPGEDPLGLDLTIDHLELRDSVLVWSDPALEADLQGSVRELVFDGGRFSDAGSGSPVYWYVTSGRIGGGRVAVAPVEAPALEFDLDASAGPLEAGERVPVVVEVSREEGARIRLDGELHPDPLEIVAKLQWEDLQSRALAPILALAGLDIERGHSSAELEMGLALADVPDRGLALSGHVRHDDLVLEVDDPETSSPIHCELVRLEGELAELWLPLPVEGAEAAEPLSARFARIELVSPSLDFTLSAPGEIDAPSPELGEPAETNAEASRAPPQIAVDGLSLRDGVLVWRDPTLGPDHERRLTGIVLEAASFQWPSGDFEQATLVVGSLGKPPLRIDASAPPESADVKLRASRLALATWNPEISRYTDYSVTRGSLSIESDLALRRDRYEAPTIITLQGLEADSRNAAFQRTFGVPLAVAIPLLSDRSGRIRLDMPVSGTLSEGARLDLVVPIAGALQQAIRNAIGNALSAPVDIAGSVLRRGGELFLGGIGEASFDPGESALEFDARLSIDAAVQVERRTSNLVIQLVPVVVTDDLGALGHSARKGLLDTPLSIGRALLGGGKAVPEDARGPFETLAVQRMDAVERYLREAHGFTGDQITRETWDGRSGEGLPRVMLRLKRR